MPPATRRFSKKYGAFKYTKSKGKKARMAAKRKASRRSKPRNSIIASHAPGGMTHSQMTYKGGSAKLGRGYNALSAVNTLVLQDRRNLTTYFGNQDANSLCILNSLPDLAQIANCVAKTNGISAQGGPIPPGGINAQKFMMEGVEANVTLTNQSSCPCIVDLYDVSVKINPTPSPVSYGDNNDVSSPIAAWRSGLNQTAQTIGPYPQAGAPSAIDPHMLLGVLPTDSPLFRDYYRINKRTTVEMGPTSTHVHRLVSTHKKVFDVLEVVTATAQSPVFLNWGPFTRHLFAVVRGNPVFDETITRAVTAPICVLVQISERYRYSVVSYGGGVWNYNTQYSTAPASGDTLKQYSISQPGVLSPPEVLVV